MSEGSKRYARAEVSLDGRHVDATGLGGEGWWHFPFAAFFLFWGVVWAINRKAWRDRPGRKRPLDDFPVPYRAIWRWHKRRHA